MSARKQVMPTVFERAAEVGKATFPAAWQAIQTMVALGRSDQQIVGALRSGLRKRGPSRQYWDWVEDAITAARRLSQIEADRRRREFRIVR